MKTNVRDTSIAAYDSVDLSRGQRRVVEFLMKYPERDWTRNELATKSGIPINCVTPRVLELIRAGVLEERVRRGCRVSGKQAHAIRVAPRQMELV